MIGYIFNFAEILVLAVVLYFLIRPLVRGAVFFPTKERAVEAMVRLARVEAGERMADLGAGDGRVLIAFAKQGIEAHGFEVNPIFVWLARRGIRKAGLAQRAFVHWKSFWDADFSAFDIVSVYGIGYIMNPLAVKLGHELKPGSRIVSNVYELPGWRRVGKEESVSLYRVDR